MTLEEMTAQYIAYRRSLGEKFKTNASFLKAFVKFIGAESKPYELTMEMTSAFLMHPTGTVTQSWFCKHSALKGLFQWAQTRGIMTQAPLTSELPNRMEHIRPYIYTTDELRRLFSSAMKYQKNRSPTYPECVKMILQMTYFLGLRLHETMSLRIKDVNIQESYIYICESKFYKSRITPFSHKVGKLIASFLAWRKENGMPDTPDTALFLNRNQCPVTIDTVRGSFERIRAHAGVSRNDGALYQPRIHDLRHTFAVNRLTLWYREGKDVQKLLPLLSTYMGHAHLCHTSVYLTMTDSLLGEACKRFDKYANNHET